MTGSDLPPCHFPSPSNRPYSVLPRSHVALRSGLSAKSIPKSRPVEHDGGLDVGNDDHGHGPAGRHVGSVPPLAARQPPASSYTDQVIRTAKCPYCLRHAVNVTYEAGPDEHGNRGRA